MDAVEGIDVCVPWESDAPPCPSGTARFVGASECAALGAPCPPDGFADGGLTDPVYVRAGAAGGDGSRSRPFATIGEALGSGAPIAIAPGIYRETLHLPDGAALVGACAAETVIEGRLGAGAETLGLSSGSARIEGLTVRGPTTGIRVSDSELAVRNVIVEATSFAGVVVRIGGSMEVDGLVVRDVAEVSGTIGSGFGIGVIDRAQMRGRRVTIERTVGVGMTVLGSESDATITDLAVSDVTIDTVMGISSVGITLGRDATSSFERVLVERTAIHGLDVEDGAVVSATDLVVRDIGGGEGFPAAVVAASGGRLTVSRASVLDVAATAFAAFGETSEIAVEDAIAARLGAGASPYAPGLGLGFGAHGSLERVLIVEATGVGVIAGASRESVVMRDVTISRVQASADLETGRGVSIENASVDTERLHVADVFDIGVLVAGATPGRLVDVRIERVSGALGSGRFGRGLSVESGGLGDAADVELERIRVSEAHEAGFAVFGRRVRAGDVAVTDTGTRACASTTCRDLGGGAGILLIDEANLTLERFVSTRNALVGIQVEGATVHATSGEVSSNVIGLNVNRGDFALDEAFTDVAFIDNASNLDSMTLPVPRPATTIEP